MVQRSCTYTTLKPYKSYQKCKIAISLPKDKSIQRLSRISTMYVNSSQAYHRTMWTTLCMISCVLVVWSSELVGATDNSHAVLKVRDVVGESSTHYNISSQCNSILVMDVPASDLLHGLSVILNSISIAKVTVHIKHSLSQCSTVYIDSVDHNYLEVHQ